MTSLTINLDENVKVKALKKTKSDGVTLTFVINQSLKAYNEGKLKFGFIVPDEAITSSFDISTAKGKKACLESFSSLCK